MDETRPVRVRSWYEDGDQEVLNAQPIPRRWTTAPLPPGPIPALARIVWSRDGEEILPTRALAWAHDRVQVETPGGQTRFNAAWLPAVDVRRRDG